MKFLDKRYIRLYFPNYATGWKLHTRKLHRQLVENPPQSVEIRLCDYYPGLPEGSAATELVSFPVFHLIGREAILQDEAQEAAKKNHIDDREMEDYILSTEAERHLHRSAEDEFFKQEQRRELQRLLDTCTAVQRERFYLYYIYGYTFREIAAMQKCNIPSVAESIKAARKKLKMFP